MLKKETLLKDVYFLVSLWGIHHHQPKLPNIWLHIHIKLFFTWLAVLVPNIKFWNILMAALAEILDLTLSAVKMEDIFISTFSPVVWRWVRRGSACLSVDICLPLAINDGFKFEPATLCLGTVHLYVHQPVMLTIPLKQSKNNLNIVWNSIAFLYIRFMGEKINLRIEGVILFGPLDVRGPDGRGPGWRFTMVTVLSSLHSIPVKMAVACAPRIVGGVVCPTSAMTFDCYCTCTGWRVICTSCYIEILIANNR
jgi:hypothetical protein